MAVKIDVSYKGGLHCELTHGPSKSHIETDAPVDNHGRGEKFSPTDLVGAALGSCVLTTMALKFEGEGIDLKGATATVEKEMNPSPRRIAKLTVQVTMPAGIPKDQRARIEAVAHACPVVKTLSSDVEVPMTFAYPD